MEKTIAAISTAMAPSGISIIRISGDRAIEIADQVYRSKSGKKLVHQKSHTIHYGFIHEGEMDIDEVLVSIMRAPHTFTGEDTVEINCHGSILASKKILETVISHGAFLAEPGEFTKRAFLNGKMDLSKAEAVISVIDAKNEFALKASVSQLKGKVSEKIKEIRNTILDNISFVEAALDDPEHYDLDGFSEELYRILTPLKDELEKLLKKADYGSMISEGVKTVIAGRPNAGKSSLLNLLAGYEKAIVTDVAGTTRDIMEVPVMLSEISLILMDTAGIRDTEDTVEKIGVTKAKDALMKADLVLYVVDKTVGIVENDLENLKDCGNKKVIVLFNKSDLSGNEISDEDVRKIKEVNPDAGVLSFSASEGKNADVLEEMIISLYDEEKISYNDEVYITNVRQKALLKEAVDAINLVFSGISSGYSEEFLNIDLFNAYETLGKIIGEAVEDDVIDRVFEKFCMGK